MTTVQQHLYINTCTSMTAAPQIWNHIPIPPSESHHHLTPSNVTAKHTTCILSRHNFLTTCSDCPAPLIYFFNLGALPNILHYTTTFDVALDLFGRPEPWAAWPVKGSADTEWNTVMCYASSAPIGLGGLREWGGERVQIFCA